MKKAKQAELAGMPDRSPLGKLAAQFADLDVEIAALQLKQKAVASEMLPLFKDTGKKAIKLDDGTTVKMTTKSASTTVSCDRSEKKRNTLKDTDN